MPHHRLQASNLISTICYQLLTPTKSILYPIGLAHHAALVKGLAKVYVDNVYCPSFVNPHLQKTKSNLRQFPIEKAMLRIHNQYLPFQMLIDLVPHSPL